MNGSPTFSAPHRRSFVRGPRAGSIIVALLTVASVTAAPAQDTTHAAPAAPAPGPKYPLAPTPVFGIGALSSRPAFSGYLSARMTRRDGATGFLLNRGRLTVQAAPKPFFAIKLQGDFSGAQKGRLRSDSTVAGFSLTDAYVELVAPPAMAPSGSLLAGLRPALVVGQFKSPFSLEYLTSFSSLKTANRSQAVDRLSQKRDIGAMAQVGWRRFATLSAAVVNGEGPNATANADGSEMVLSRLTITPVRFLELSAKISNEGADRAWGYDGRLLWRKLTVEGEGIYRKRPTSSDVFTHAGGGYALIAYKLLPWLEPVYKYDRYWDRRTTTVGQTITEASTHSTWNVFGVNVQSSPEWLRLQLDWVERNEQPSPGRSHELIAQVIAIF